MKAFATVHTGCKQPVKIHASKIRLLKTEPDAVGIMTHSGIVPFIACHFAIIEMPGGGPENISYDF
ncbi:hypothetical protein B4098_0504 [Heyndrickxia coagulans]|uniref:Uncharacterized protein n=1 Tax=Heyndrickxia coagulans TaxID=1398 RepID=A0A133KSR0_HEYCO|nr:hypothetical protein HMPREF3213_01755 [Heyndrickxia coagulans]KYC64832.1 hypothetical protein B4098_0504 [Heyndrickxia coagulans]